MTTPRFNYQDILSTVINADIREYDRGPLICLDESLNNQTVQATIETLLKRGLAADSCYLWSQPRIRTDGSLVSVMGGLRRHVSIPGLDLGRPAKYLSWDDRLVVYRLLAHFTTYTTLVLLTENTKTAQFGLRRLLRIYVKPYLSTNHLDRFSLTALFKKWRTNYPDYCRRVAEVFEEGAFTCGYSEVEL